MESVARVGTEGLPVVAAKKVPIPKKEVKPAAKKAVAVAKNLVAAAKKVPISMKESSSDDSDSSDEEEVKPVTKIPVAVAKNESSSDSDSSAAEEVAQPTESSSADSDSSEDKVKKAPDDCDSSDEKEAGKPAVATKKSASSVFKSITRKKDKVAEQFKLLKQLRERKKKKKADQLFDELNKVALGLEIQTNQQLNKRVRVNIQYLDRDIKADLKELANKVEKKAAVEYSADELENKLIPFKKRQFHELQFEELKIRKQIERARSKSSTLVRSVSESSASDCSQNNSSQGSSSNYLPDNPMVDLKMSPMVDTMKSPVIRDRRVSWSNSRSEDMKSPATRSRNVSLCEQKETIVYNVDPVMSPSESDRKVSPIKLSLRGVVIERPSSSSSEATVEKVEVILEKVENSSQEERMKLHQDDNAVFPTTPTKLSKFSTDVSKALENSEDSTDNSDFAQYSAKKKFSVKKRKLLDSDSDASGSEDKEADEESEQQESCSLVDKKKKRKSSSSDHIDSDRPKKKRKRIKGGSDSEGKQEEIPNKGIYESNIQKEKQFTYTSKEAVAEEKARRQRMEVRQALYNSTFSLPESRWDGEGMIGQLVLDFDHETKDVLVEVDKKLVKVLKPHQVNGVKFLWDACYESIEHMKSGMEGGAILAHCMGLGKTLQTITLTHTLLDNKKVNVNRVMVICPVNTVKNWHDEYEKWLIWEHKIDVYEMSAEKDNWGRADRINQWFSEGGVLIIGYEMFRNLVSEKNSKFHKIQRETFNYCLLDPGPDLVICDEGHLLKNEKSAINKAVNRIKTHRR